MNIRKALEDKLAAGKIDELTFLKANVQLTELLEKAHGEGSRGGKVIGHTKSGKAIYEGKAAHSEEYKDFSEKDHDEARHVHMRAFSDGKAYANGQEADEAAADHGRAADRAAKKEKLVKKIDSIKTEAHISSLIQQISKLSGSLQSEMRAKLSAKMKDMGLIKAEESELIKGGEGSKGGKVIGHTRSGKPIYEDGKHSHYGNFHEDDHHEAANHHSQLAERARVKKNSHESLRRMAEEDKDRDGVKEHAAKVKEHDEKEIHHSAQSVYHSEQARPQATRDRYSEVGKRVEKIRSK